MVGNRILELAAHRGARTILDIDLAFVDAYRSERASKADERGKMAAPRTIMNETVKIRGFAKFAFTRKMISQDPLAGLKIQKVKSHGQPCWSPSEVESILAALVGHYHDAFVLWADTGMRFAEVAWMTWADIDLANNAILIRAKAGWKPKKGEERVVPMTARVRAMLTGRAHEFNWLFTMRPSAKYPHGDHQLQESRLLEYLQRRLERLYLQGMIHTFRHSFITNALLAGIPEAIVRQWVGHLDRDVTKIYTHVRSSDSQAAMQRLSDLMAPPSTKGHKPTN